jgi:cytochrome P450
LPTARGTLKMTQLGTVNLLSELFNTRDAPDHAHRRSGIMTTFSRTASLTATIESIVQV